MALKAFRDKVAPISLILEENSFIAPGKHATLAKIRKYMFSEGKITSAEKKLITEGNCVQKWELYFGPLPRGDDDLETDTDSF